MKLRALTNVKPTKELGTQVILSCTKGQLKVTPDAAKLLGVGNGDYCGVVYDDEAKVGYVFKGSEDTFGGKLASSNKGGGGILTFSAAAGWDELGGDKDFNTAFNVGETAVDPALLEGTDFAGFTLYPLEYDSKEPKQARKAKSDSSDDKVEASEEAEATSEVAPATNSFDDL